LLLAIIYYLRRNLYSKKRNNLNVLYKTKSCVSFLLAQDEFAVYNPPKTKNHSASLRQKPKMFHVKQKVLFPLFIGIELVYGAVVECH